MAPGRDRRRTGDVGAGQSVVVDFFSRGNEFIWSGGSEGFWIEIVKALCESRKALPGSGRGHIKHNVVGPPAVNERLHLVLQVFGLLSRKPRDWIISMKPCADVP